VTWPTWITTRDLAATIAIAIVLALVLVWLHTRWWVRRLRLELEYASFERVATPDGSAIELRRVPCARIDRDLPPILLVHGVAANHRNQDVHPDFSLARHLAALGRDVWLVTLRSGRGDVSWWRRRKIRFEPMARFDVPLAIEAVRAKTGADVVDYVGFSMGGLLLYAALDRAIDPRVVRRVVIVGSPARMEPPSLVPRALLRVMPRVFVPHLPLRLGARTLAFLSEWITTPIHRMVANPRNVFPGVTRLALVDVIEDMPAALNADFVEAMARPSGVLRFDDEPIDARLHALAIPALFVAGAGDKLAPPRSVRHAFDLWACDHGDVAKRFVILGRDHGSREDYGHGDLAVGAHVAVELFPLIADWLDPASPSPRASTSTSPRASTSTTTRADGDEPDAERETERSTDAA
jgi:pimeloyl-ACP methyl ester carboxylesterase